MEDEKKSGSEDINLDQTTDFTKAIAEALEPIRKKMDCDKQAIIVCGIDLGINDENNHCLSRHCYGQRLYTGRLCL